MNELLKILSNSNKDIDNQKLMDYLAGKLSGKEKHQVEEWMNENEFINDAIEGLQSLEQPLQASAYVEQLNRQLNTYLAQKNKRRTRKAAMHISWTVIAIILILVLAILGYLVIHKSSH